MKRELINESSSKIYIDDVTENDVIEIYTEGKRVGTICYADNSWLSIKHNDNLRKCESLSDALSWWKNSKFYVNKECF